MSHMKGSVNYGQVADEIAQILADYGDHAVKVPKNPVKPAQRHCGKVPRKADQSGNRTETAGRANW